jgi:hypothetical protein
VLSLADRSQVVPVRSQALENGPDLPDRTGLERLVLLVLPNRLEQISILKCRRQPVPRLVTVDGGGEKTDKYRIVNRIENAMRNIVVGST